MQKEIGKKYYKQKRCGWTKLKYIRKKQDKFEVEAKRLNLKSEKDVIAFVKNEREKRRNKEK